MIPVVIIGAGGHGRVVVDLIRAHGRYRPVGVLDDEPALTDMLGVPIVGTTSDLVRAQAAGAVCGIVAVGDNLSRRNLAQRLVQRGFSLTEAIVHPRSVVSTHVVLGLHVTVGPGAIMNVGAVVAEGTIINSGAIVEHDCVVGEYSHLCPGCRLGGGVRVGSTVLIGIGAVVLPGLSIGDGARIGAGAVVTDDVRAGKTVAGVPAVEIHGGGA